MKRTSMKKIKKIIKLGLNGDLSFREIARAVNTSRPNVTKYLDIFRASGLTCDEFINLDKTKIAELLAGYSRKNSSTNERYAVLEGKFEYLLCESKKKHVTLQKLWEEYKEEHPDGYGRTQFFEYFKRWKQSCELTMHLEHKAGDKMFVDFAGKKFYLTDRTTGNKKPVETFVAILPASSYTFVCATETQKTADWIKGTQEAFWYFGGTTTAVTPDCYKSAVKKYNRYDPEINPLFSRFAEHYGTVVLPARPYHPKDKALVEGAVKIVYAWIYSSLRNREFYSLEELNRAITVELEKYNNKKMQASGLSRLEVFEKTERDCLKPLPAELFEHKQYTNTVIQTNYHVKLKEDNRYYSVPYRYYKTTHLKKKPERVDIYYSQDIVEIYYKLERIATHKRVISGSKYTTKAEHMPEKHQRYLERWNPERLINLAKTKGSSVAELIDKLIAKHKHPEQSYNTCRGIIFLSKNYGPDRLNKACKKALYLGYLSYKTVDDILKNNQEEMPVQQELFDKTIPDHENIRGKLYYENMLVEATHE